MKKIMTLVLAIGVIAGVQAQQRQVVRDMNYKLSEMKQLKQESSLFNNDKMAKAPVAKTDTLKPPAQFLPNPIYTWGGWGIYPKGAWENPEIMISVKGPMHSFNMNGSGEVGMIYHTEAGQYEAYMGVDLSTKVICGAVMFGVRWGSTDWALYGYDSTPAMKVYFKVYQDLQDQEFYSSLMSATPEILTMKYPVDPYKYAASDTTEAYASKIITENNAKQLSLTRIGAAFKTPVPANKDFAISYVAPHSNEAIDSIYNYAPVWYGQEKTGTIPGDFFSLYDYYRQSLWYKKGADFSDTSMRLKQRDGEAGPTGEEGFLPKGNPQRFASPNYMFTPVMTDFWEDGPNIPFLSDIYIWPVVTMGNSNENLNALAKNVSVYPIPAIEDVTFTSIDPMSRIDIYNTQGQLVKTVITDDNITTVSISDLRSGFYVAKITTPKGLITKKIVVNK
ncbi:MAG: T9SS type A sorting domain-containing protein [Bacteroidales bacterium]